MICSKVLLILLLAFEWRVTAISYKPNDDAHGVRMSFNNYFTVAAFNHENKYYIRFLSTNNDLECVIPYHDPELYVYSLSVITMKKSSKKFSFVQIGENQTSNHAILSWITFTIAHCNGSSVPIASDKTVWQHGHQESMMLKIDPQEKYAYVFADSFMLSYDLSTREVQRRNNTFYGSSKSVIVTALDLTNEWAFMIGYTPTIRGDFSYSHFYIVHLLSKTLSQCDDCNVTFLTQMSTQSIYRRDHSASISINPSGNLLAVGVPIINQVQIFEISRIIQCSFKSIGNIRPAHHLDTIGIGFGRSVAWLTDQGPLAVLVYNPKYQMLSESEIHVFKTNLPNNEIPHAPPDFIFPNNQQRLPKTWKRKSFLLIQARSNNLLILCDTHRYIYIPSTGPGSRSVLINEKPRSAFVLQSKPCVSGTYKNISDLGPCIVCPPGTKNTGDVPATTCQPCNSRSFCPLGSSHDVTYDDFISFKSYNQTFEYPESPAIDDYDDMLMRNFFVVEETIGCKFKLPRVWTFMAITASFVIWLIMFVIKRWQPTSVDSHRKRAKTFLKQMDLIGEGELLVGGLTTLVILVIIIHSCWFANEYFYSYPIERVNSSRLQCRNNHINSQFDNALQLPLPAIDGVYATIFDMLNQQKFTMTIHLINTRAECDNITVARLRHMGTPEKITMKNCTLKGYNATGLFSFDLATHTDSIQVKIEGPYFIGALQICLHGAKGLDKVVQQKRHQLEEMDMCTLFYTDNQTIGLMNSFNVHLIKVINVTEPLKVIYETNYTGRWAPYIKYIDDLSDEYYFKKDGQYLRYASVETTFNVRLSEEFYFLQNIQTPIVRRYELIFHTFLFIFLIIDIFAMIFVVYKLWFQPPLRKLLISHHNLFICDLQTGQTEIVVDSPLRLPRSSESQLQFTVEHAKFQASENLKTNLALEMDENSQRDYRTSDNVLTKEVSETIAQSSLPSSQLSDPSVRLLKTSSTAEAPGSFSHLTVEDLLEYFDKRFKAVAQNMERLMSDVGTLRNQIDDLIPDVIHLKQHMHSTNILNKDTHDDKTNTETILPRREQP